MSNESEHPKSIQLVPNYEEIFNNFLRDAVNFERDVLQIGDIRTRYSMPYDRSYWEEFTGKLRDDFRAVHNWLGAFVVALQAASKLEDLQRLREVAAAFLTKVAEEGIRRDREADELDEYWAEED